MRDVTRALEQIAEIHGHLARHDVYRGWRSAPIAATGLVGLGAAAYQSSFPRPLDPPAFVVFWSVVAAIALVAGHAEVAWRYIARATPAERRRSHQVWAQFLPAPVAGAVVTVVLMRFSPAMVTLLPGLWALFFGFGIFAAGPFMTRASGWVALYFWMAGLALLWLHPAPDHLSPWMVGGTLGAGQLFAAAVLYWNLERPR